MPISDLAAIPDALLAIPHETRIDRVPFAQALHRLSGEDITLATARPPCALAACAGFAVLPEDDHTARRTTWRIAGTSAIGVGTAPMIRPGECLAVHAGSPLPNGAVVIPTAQVIDHGESIHVSDHAALTVAAIPAGCDAAAGSLLIARLQPFDPSHQALAGWCGLDEVAVIAAPRTALLTPEPIYGSDALGPLLMAHAMGWNLPASRHRLPSDPSLRIQAIANASDRARVVVVCADGRSLVDAERQLGFTPILHPLPLDRGSAGIARRASGVLLLDLPIDPGACMVAVHLILWPVLARLHACAAQVWRTRPLLTPLSANEQRSIAPVRFSDAGVEVLNGSGLHTWALATGLALLADDSTSVPVLPWAHRGR